MRHQHSHSASLIGAFQDPVPAHYHAFLLPKLKVGLLQVTQAVAKCFHWVDLHHERLLGGLILAWVVHLLVSLLLLLGAMLHRRWMLLPWLCSHLTLLVVMVVTFVSWTFLSFFVDLLVPVIFPVCAGLFLGLWIFLWRGVSYHPYIYETSAKRV